MTTLVSQFPSGDGKWEVPFSGTNVHPRWSRTGDRLSVMDDLARIVEFPVDRTRGMEIAAPLLASSRGRHTAVATTGPLTESSSWCP